MNQELTLFATIILENILYGKPDATIAEVEAATTSANAHIHYYRIDNHRHHFHRQFRAICSKPAVILITASLCYEPLMKIRAISINYS